MLRAMCSYYIYCDSILCKNLNSNASFLTLSYRRSHFVACKFVNAIRRTFNQMFYARKQDKNKVRVYSINHVFCSVPNCMCDDTVVDSISMDVQYYIVTICILLRNVRQRRAIILAIISFAQCTSHSLSEYKIQVYVNSQLRKK